MAELRHELIRASAGTGKTYQLTNRYLRILFLTQEPEKIIALTFTRKAAGEFFEKIFRRLATAAEDDTQASRLGAELGLRLTASECIAALRLLLSRLHQLQLSTYDSFFTRIVQTFPFELGLAGAPSLLDEDQQLQAIERAQHALSRRAQKEDVFLTDFWHAVKRATMGVQMKSIRELVTGFIQKNHALYFDAASDQLWGQENIIWPEGSPWRGEEIDWSAAARELAEAIDWAWVTAPQGQFLRELIQELDTWRPPVELPRRIEYFLPRILENFHQLQSGQSQMMVNRKTLTITAEVGEIFRRIGRAIYWSTVHPRLVATQGIFDLVRLFEEVYHREVRQLGQLTLEDAARLLAGGATHGAGLGDRNLRIQLGYRLDGSFDHWLLDEFQDTSRVQWKAISELVEEVLSDPERRRSFFAVGDSKQSLYGWRGSDDALFDQVQQKYEKVLSVRALNESFRSAPAVLELANAVFGQTEIIAELFTPNLAARWAAMWQAHVSAPTLSPVSGYSCVLHTGTAENANFETVGRLLYQLKPVERGLSVAVLTQKNSTADALVEFLRANGGPPCSLAANVQPGVDNAVAAGLHSFLTLAAHPQDKLAWQHLRMTPLGAELQKQFATPARLSAALLGIWSEHGLRGLVEAWAQRCHAHLDTGDTFNRGRIDLFRDAAAGAEERGERDIDLFIRQLAAMSLREHDNPGQVAVMTIHKAKGLDWDLVIVTDLEGDTLMERRGGLEVHRDAEGEIEWILDMPPSHLAQFDPALARRIKLSQEAVAFERLCVLYVGLTRAKTALYVVTSPTKGTSKNFPRLLAETLGDSSHALMIGEEEFTCAWEAGDPQWVEKKKSTAVPLVPQKQLPALSSDERRHAAHTSSLQPSAEKARELRGDALLTRDRRQRDLGTELHAALSQLEGVESLDRESGDVGGVRERNAFDASDTKNAVARESDEMDTGQKGDLDSLERIANAFLATSGVELSEKAQAALRAVLANSAVRALLAGPTANTKVWRELPFEILINRHWISGRLDRVVLTLDAGGKAIGARIIDFKIISALRDGAAFVRQNEAQMKTYCDVVARLWKLPQSAVKTTLVAISTEGEPRVEVFETRGLREARRATFNVKYL